MPKRGFLRGQPWVTGAALAVLAAASSRRLAERPVESPSTPALSLKELIAREQPQLAATPPLSLARLTLLRQWAYENVDWSTPRANLDDDRSNGFYEMDAPQLFSAFRSDRGGVACMGTAYAFMRLCRLYGYDALTLDYGVASLWTHVVTLVRLRLSGRDVWSIQDPTFDVAYVRRGGAPFDYLALLQALVDRRDDEVLVEKGHGGSREFIVAREDVEGFRLNATFDGFVGRLPNGSLKYRRRFSLDFLNEVPKPVAEYLTRRGQPVKAVYLFSHPIRISGGWDFDREQHSVDQAIRPRFMMKRAYKILGLGEPDL
jgi:hypothetical protein